MAKFGHCKPSRLRILQAAMKETGGGGPSNGTAEALLGHQANTKAGRAHPVLPENSLIVHVAHTANMVSDFYDHRLFSPRSYPDIFSHAVGGHLDKSCKEWSQFCLWLLSHSCTFSTQHVAAANVLSYNSSPPVRKNKTERASQEIPRRMQRVCLPLNSSKFHIADSTAHIPENRCVPKSPIANAC